MIEQTLQGSPLLKSLAEPPLNPNELKTLDQLLGASQSIFYLHGATTALLVSPETPAHPPPAILEAIQAQRFTAATSSKKSPQWLRRFYNHLRLAVTNDEVLIPLVDHQPLSLDDFLEHRLNPAHMQNLAIWCRGFLANLHLNDWFGLAGDKAYALLDPIALLSTDPGYTERLCLHPQSSASAQDLEQRRQSAIRKLPSFIISIFDFWRVQSPVHSDLRKHTPRVIAPHAPCPCLSEKTYGTCCAERLFRE